MSQFQPALPIVLKDEGGYYNDPLGGPTNFGITQNSLNKWRPGKQVQELTLQDANAFYQDYWNAQPYGQINSQAIANKLFDAAVNMGPEHAIECLQRAYNLISVSAITVDGQLGPETIRAVNAANPDKLLTALIHSLVVYYIGLHNLSDERGWLARALR